MRWSRRIEGQEISTRPKEGNVRVYLERWLQDGRARWEPQTFRTYTSIINNHVSPWLGDRALHHLTPPDIRTWMRQLADDDVGAPTRKRALSVLRSAFKQLIDDWELDRNPCDPVKGPKLRRKALRIPSPGEMKQLLKHAKPFWLFTFSLLALTGTMREGEMFALHWTQVDLDNGSILIDKSLAEDWNGQLERKMPKTKSSVRTLHLPKVTVLALQALKRKQRRNKYYGPWVFPDSEGGPLRKSNFIRRFWKPLLVAAGLTYFRFHTSRHWGNSLLIQQGEDPLSIARRMGHTDTRMTFDTYGHLFEGSGRRAASSMERGLDAVGIDSKTFRLSDDQA